MRKIPINPPSIEGWKPGLHVGLAENPRIITGKNYRWVMGHVCSGWGNDFCGNYIPRVNPEGDFGRYVATFLVGTRAVVLTPYGAYGQVAENYSSWEELISFSPTQLSKTLNAHREDFDYPWSRAFVGDTYFFCHPAVGLVSYQYPTNIWTYHGENLLGQEDCPLLGPYYSIAAINNRLVLQTRDTISWSQPDNGLKLTCSTICGGNFVSSSVLEYGQPIGIASFGDNGIAWTTRGAMMLTPFAPSAAQATAMAVMGFRVSKQARSAVPINPYAFTHGPDGSVMFLSKSGLTMINSDGKDNLDAEFSNWLIERVFPRLATMHNQHAVRLNFSLETDELFVSVQHMNPRYRKDNVYAQSYVYSTRHKKWASFDQEHFCIGPVNFGADTHLDYMLGFIGSDMRPHWFNFALYNSYGDGLIPLDSRISIGPFSVNRNEEIFHVDSTITRFRLYCEANHSVFNPYELDYHGHIDLNAPLLVSLSTYSDRDCGSCFAHNAKANEVKLAYLAGLTQSSLVQTFGCYGNGVYHTINLTTDPDKINQFYSIASVSVELGITNTIA